MRSLASIVTVKEVWPLKGKDRVQGASFVENAYEAMIGKDIQAGELVAFIQEGSILPETEHWEFLRKRCFKEGVGHIIRVQKFKEIKSWGLVLKLNELGLDEKVYGKFKAGTDITELLGIKKYEPEEDASPRGDSKKAYPKWVKFCLSHSLTRWIGRIWQKYHTSEVDDFPTNLISKSDETTIQNYQEALEKYKDEEVYTSIKMEGKSATMLLPLKKNGKPGKFYVCSRNKAYKTPGNNDFWKYAKDNGIEHKLTEYYNKTGKALILQGELCGPGIQSNIYHFDKLTFLIYTVKEQTKDEIRQLPWKEMVDTVHDLMLLPVPMIENKKLKDIMPDIESAVNYAESRYFRLTPQPDGTYFAENYYTPRNGEKLWRDYAQHEGVVVRSVNYDKDKNIGVSFKVKNIDYAEKGIGPISNIEWKGLTK